MLSSNGATQVGGRMFTALDDKLTICSKSGRDQGTTSMRCSRF